MTYNALLIDVLTTEADAPDAVIVSSALTPTAAADDVIPFGAEASSATPRGHPTLTSDLSVTRRHPSAGCEQACSTRADAPPISPVNNHQITKHI